MSAFQQPDFFDGFSCKCGACRRTCCSGDWLVGLSEDEYRADMDESLGIECHDLAQRCLKPNPAATGDRDYASCVTREDGFCSLLTDDGLCGWQKLQGRCVGSICDEFPRTYIRHLDTTYLFPTCACEKVVEMLLSHDGPVNLVSGSSTIVDTAMQVDIDEAMIARRPLLGLYPQTIGWALAVLQNRRFTLDERMGLLGNMMWLIECMEREGRVGDIPASMRRFLDPRGLDEFLTMDGMSLGESDEGTTERANKDGMAADRADDGASARKVLIVIGNVMGHLAGTSHYGDKVEDVLSCLGVDAKRVELDGHASCEIRIASCSAYLDRKKRLADSMKDREAFLEGLMVCEYLRSLMPITEPGVWDAYRAFVVDYILHRSMFLACLDDASTDEQVVDAVVTLHRMLLHDRNAGKKTLRCLDRLGFTTLPAMLSLVNG